MKTKKAIELLLLLSAAAFAVPVRGEATARASLCLNPEKSIVWKTATLPFAVDLSWPKGAAAATVAVDDGVRRSPRLYEWTDTSVTNGLLDLAAPLVEDDERVLSLTLSFTDAQGATIETRTARIGLVRGVSGAAFRVLGANVPASVWQSAGRHAVLPYPDGATGLSADGVDVTGLSAPDWYFAKAAPGTHVYALSTSAGVQSETLLLTCQGLSIIIR